MGSFSISHWLVILAVVVLLFGAKKIPELAKGVGQGIKDFKKAIKEDEQAKTTVDQVETKLESGATPTATTSTPSDEKKSV
ncbi:MULTISPECIES: twin-arginine translocase TatA/TatE family subunit [unclassified Sulfurospirillum]|uniref:twin-arginine translocase TatA/TatE family subunit n=1 Tax=unclassified Sulfurospirillum TaxID=2618290 RepID=UPI000500EF5C|nr:MULTISPECIES: twin-arginine translocase TatA/TatE family subunit [unclassified Sulfurospirillum]KFL34803.1 preprotein translocase subunit TatA [Sulfurospirillum sp. SCADC]